MPWSKRTWPRLYNDGPARNSCWLPSARSSSTSASSSLPSVRLRVAVLYNCQGVLGAGCLVDAGELVVVEEWAVGAVSRPCAANVSQPRNEAERIVFRSIIAHEVVCSHSN